MATGLLECEPTKIGWADHTLVSPAADDVKEGLPLQRLAEETAEAIQVQTVVEFLNISRRYSQRHREANLRCPQAQTEAPTQWRGHSRLQVGSTPC